MEELLDRLDRIERQIPQIRNKIARKDLIKMLATIDTSMRALDQESVECRRLRKETVRYQELLTKTQGLIANLEQHLTFAALLNG